MKGSAPFMRSFVLGPGVPQACAEIMRKAFRASHCDPQMRADADRM
jgi:hypothetical protein